MEFDDFLISKKINPIAFKHIDGERYALMKNNFEQISVESFTQQFLYVFNPLRHKFPLNNKNEAGI